MPHRIATWPRKPASGPAARVDRHHAPNGKVRWLTTLTPEAEAAYAAAVAEVVPAVEGRLGPEVMADRALASGGPVALRLAPWEAARRRWRAAAIRGLGGTTRAVVVTDVRDCFASITPALVRRTLREAGASPQAVARVLGCLEAFHEDGARGLPVGPAPSAVLANAALGALDSALRVLGVPYLRWVDDVVAFAPSVTCGRDALDAVRRASDGLGLVLHDAKTRIVLDPSEAWAILGGSNSPGAAASMA